MKKVSIDSDLASVHILSEHLRQFLECYQLTDEQLSTIDIMLVEAATNIIEHAYNCEPNYSVNAEYSIKGKRLRIALCDTGEYYPGYEDISEASLPDADNLPEGGWGIGLINSIADKVTYTRKENANKLVMEKLLLEECSEDS